MSIIRSAWLCVAVGLLAIGCTDSNLGDQPAVPDDADVAQKTLSEEFGQWSGKVLIQSAGEDQIVVAVANPARPLSENAVVNEVYILASAVPIGTKINVEYDLATVTRTSRSLTVSDLAGVEILDFVLAESQTNVFGAGQIAGYQIARYLGEFSLRDEQTGRDFDRLTEDAVIAGLVALTEQGCAEGGSTDQEVPPECSSGGPGSTSCSISGCPPKPTGCSTDCAAGYFACCNCGPRGGAFCSCFLNGSGG